ncbi:hypothetical protein Cob_v002103 [Colletotrichum orbiculare MAFF 240422]|uniref:Uncharacterized protein n=1 Tax=Colletotrichum orbiculare (strain 104-T / ATCC 96160 / CBS 514.97 / LARS 414 / MAFF 240422) TaxID=1213857 RepID=A0A484G6E2_COLOR|nr:hypothetical protein Cob_v002103 [Colletotrichum orbiculare MAFF 240422]
MVGGLRKVPNTPDLKQKQKATLLYPPLPEAPATNLSSSKKPRDLQPKTSFQSSITASTASDNTNYKIHSSSSPPRAETDSVLPPPSITSETTNYKVYGSSSPPAPDTDGSLLPPSSSHSNYEILGRSSPPEPSSAERSPPKTADSEQNYVIHNDWSPAPSAVTARRQKLRPVYSEESLLVAALKPQKDKKKPRERFGYYKSRSRDSLRRTASSKILSAALGQETGPKGTAAPDTFHQARVLAGVLGVQPDARAEINTIAVTESHMKAHPHQWSSQLSTVMSESEGGTVEVHSAWFVTRMSTVTLQLIIDTNVGKILLRERREKVPGKLRGVNYVGSERKSIAKLSPKPFS